MRVFICLCLLVVIATVDGQVCSATFNQNITGQCSTIAACQGTILSSSSCGQLSCCIPGMPMNGTPCLNPTDFDVLYNTSRARFLRGILSYGINSLGLCNNCQAKAAFLAIAATMTNNFTTDEAVLNSTQFTIDDSKYGNNQTGDGSRFRRRGFFGLRGRRMYQRLQTINSSYGSLNNPEASALVNNAIKIAILLWNRADLLYGK